MNQPVRRELPKTVVLALVLSFAPGFSCHGDSGSASGAGLSPASYSASGDSASDDQESDFFTLFGLAMDSLYYRDKLMGFFGLGVDILLPALNAGAISLLYGKNYEGPDPETVLRDCSDDSTAHFQRIVLVRPEYDLAATVNYHARTEKDGPVLFVLEGSGFNLTDYIFIYDQQVTICGWYPDSDNHRDKYPVIHIYTHHRFVFAAQRTFNWEKIPSLELRRLRIDSSNSQADKLISTFTGRLRLDQVVLDNSRRPMRLVQSEVGSDCWITDSHFIDHASYDDCGTVATKGVIFVDSVNRFVLSNTTIEIHNGNIGLNFYGDGWEVALIFSTRRRNGEIELTNNQFLAFNRPALGVVFQYARKLLVSNNSFSGDFFAGITFKGFYPKTWPGEYAHHNQAITGSFGNHWNATGIPCLLYPSRGDIEWDNGQVCNSQSSDGPDNLDWSSLPEPLPGAVPCLVTISENSNDPEETSPPEFQGYSDEDSQTTNITYSISTAGEPGSEIISSAGYCAPTTTHFLLMTAAGGCVIALGLF